MPEDDMTEPPALPSYLGALDGVIILAAINDRGEYLPLPAESIERKLTGELREYMRDDKVKHVVISDRQDMELVKALIPKHVPVTRARMFCDVILGILRKRIDRREKYAGLGNPAKVEAFKEINKLVEKIFNFLRNDYIEIINGSVEFIPQRGLYQLFSYVEDIRSKRISLDEHQESIMEYMMQCIQNDINHSIDALRDGSGHKEKGDEEGAKKCIYEFYKRHEILIENYKKNARKFVDSLAGGCRQCLMQMRSAC